MHSQLDCMGLRLPGIGVSYVKTCAAVPIRLDLLNFKVCIFCLGLIFCWSTSFTNQ
ncbi:uncharacterized protein F5147DRAFT_723974 [Suillus discolor]|uniref:Uncharacterized protein n=1 Tax=Suillus discolor TaxID=1912936 RepID=A0A9P7EVY0_9AGAM|nr:uncharacterized protein F5147DRAFT_723974 [Suillus discolor]KAG2091205.1 hypothetical protein F5147DRAFT_723974 [Suillus discolor]